METRPYIPWELINNFMIDVFKAYGVPEADAKIWPMFCSRATAAASRATAATASSRSTSTASRTAPCCP